MTRTKRNFAILMVTVFLIVNAFSLVSFAADDIDLQQGPAAASNGTVLATAWGVDFENIQDYFVAVNGTLQLQPVVRSVVGGTELTDLTGVAENDGYTVTYSVKRAHAVEVSETGLATGFAPGVSFVTARVVNTVDDTYAEKTIGIAVGSKIENGNSFEGVGTETTVVRSGAASWVNDGTTAATLDYTDSAAATLSTGTGVFYFYDDGVSALNAAIDLVGTAASGTGYGSPGTLKLNASGYYFDTPSDPSSQDYPYTGYSNQESPIARSAGWHQVIVDGGFSNDGYEIYIDGILVRRQMSASILNLKRLGGVKSINVTCSEGSLRIDDMAAFSAVAKLSTAAPSVEPGTGYIAGQDTVDPLTWVTFSPTDVTCKKVDLSSDNTDVVRITADNKLYFVGAGTANIAMTFREGGFNAQTSSSRTPHDPDQVWTSVVPVTVADNPDYVGLEGFSLLETEAVVAPGSTYQIISQYFPSNTTAREVTYASLDNAIATVSASGLVSVNSNATHGQTVTITATPAALPEVAETLTLQIRDTIVEEQRIVKDFLDVELTDGTTPNINASYGWHDDGDWRYLDGPKLSLTQADTDNGLASGFQASPIFGSSAVPLSDIYRIMNVTLDGQKYLVAAFTRDPATANEEGFSDLSLYRQFTPEDAIDFDQDNVYYISFVLRQEDNWGGRNLMYNLGGKIALTLQSEDSAEQNERTTLKFGDDMSGELPGQQYLGKSGNRVLMKLVTRANGEDALFVRIFGQRVTMVGKKGTYTDIWPFTWNPTTWDFEFYNTVTGKAEYYGATGNMRIQDRMNYIGGLEIYRTDSVDVENVILTDEVIEMSVGNTRQLSTHVLPSNATIQALTYTSDDPTIASVNSSTGLVTARGQGTTRIHVTDSTGTISDSLQITCYRTMDSLEFSRSDTVLDVNTRANLFLTGSRSVQGGPAETDIFLGKHPDNPSQNVSGRVNAGNLLTLTSSDPTIASVSADGVVTGYKRGSVVITATYHNLAPDARVSQVSAKVLVTVTSGRTVNQAFDSAANSNALGDRRQKTGASSYTPSTIATEPTADDIETTMFSASRALSEGVAEGWFYNDGGSKSKAGLVFEGANADTLFVGLDSSVDANYFVVNDNGNAQATTINKKTGWNQIVVNRINAGQTVVYINGEEAYTSATNAGFTAAGVQTVKNYVVESTDEDGNPVITTSNVSYYDDISIFALQGSAPTVFGTPAVEQVAGTMTLRANYQYRDDDGDPESGSIINWYLRAKGAASFTAAGTGASLDVTGKGGYEAMYELILSDASGMVSDTISSSVATIVSYGAVPGAGPGGNISPGISVPVGPSTTPDTTNPVYNYFNDIAGHWAAADINYLAQAGLLNGYPDNSFKPDNSITRAEFTTMVVGALNLPLENYISGYSDVYTGDWYATYIQTATKAGLVSGSDGKFRPNDLITREEMAKVIVAAYRMVKGTLPDGSIDMFTDKDSISSWAVDYVKAATSLGIVKGMTDTTFVPKDNATRAQAAVMIRRLIDAIR